MRSEGLSALPWSSRRSAPLAMTLFALVACSSAHTPDADAGADAASPDAAAADAGRDAGTGLDAGRDAGPPPPGDTCADAIDANAVGVTGADGVLRVFATNVAARTDLEVCEPIPASTLADVVVVYTPEVAGRLHWTLDPANRNLFFVDLRSSCEDAGSTLDCAQCACISCASPCDRRRFVEAGVPLYFVVSGVPNTAIASGMDDFVMAFELEPFLAPGETCDPGASFPRCRDDLTCQDEGDGPVCGTEVCGDGFVGYGILECDDGNTEGGDGCSASCELEEQSLGPSTCAAPAPLSLPRTRLDGVVGYGVAAGELSAVASPTASCAPGPGAEAVVLVELTAAARVEVGAERADVIAVRREGTGACDGEELACGTAASGIVLDPLEAGRYVVVVHGNGAAAAGSSYLLHVVADPL